jgi:peptidoglycan/LPS O-acetylase OafA/YrhL
MLLRFHSPIGYPWTLTVFSGLCFWWLLQELRYHQAVPPLRIFEWAGAWSYSIYLGHALVFPLLARIGMPFDFSTLGASFDWLLRTLLILAFCWLFYLLFERPSHLLARSFGSRLAKVQPV